MMRYVIAFIVIIIAVFAVAQFTSWAMQASGWNCATRKFGESLGIVVVGEPAEKSTYCTGVKP